MEILKRRGEKLPNQTVFLSGPTVNIGKIQKLIQVLEMAKTNKSLFALKQGNLDELVFGGVSGATSIGQRLLQDKGKDGYKITNALRDGETLIANAKATVKNLGVISGSLVGASMLTAGSFATVAVAIAGGAYGVYKTGQLVASNLPGVSHYASLGSAVDDLQSR